MKLLALIACGVFIFASALHSETLEQLAARDVLVKLRAVPARLDATVFPASDKIASIQIALPIQERECELAKVILLKTRSSNDALDLVDGLRCDANVEWAEVRQMRYSDARFEREQQRDPLDAPPNDPYYSLQWWLDQIEAPSAWDIVSPDSSIVLAIVDDGVYFGLQELADARWENVAEVHGISGIDDDQNGYVDDLYGYDFMDFDGDPTPNPIDGFNSHGTHVSGIAAATRNNRMGIAGVAGGAKVMGVRVGQGGSIPYGFEGVFYACQNGARAINCSWGGGTESAYEREIVGYVQSQGCVVVASAGNNGNSLPRYPAAIEGVLSVAATAEDNTGAHFTSFGPWVKVAAPGVHILSLVVDGTYGAWQGTSMAAPIVTAVCGLVMKQHPEWTSGQVVTAICNSADPIDSVNDTLVGRLGLGRVNAYRAVSGFEIPVGVRLSSVRFHENVGDGDNRIEAGEQALLDIEIVNEHGELQGVSGTVISELYSIIVDPIGLTYPATIGNGYWWSDFTEPRIQMSAEVDRGAVLPLIFEWRDATTRIIGRGTTIVLLDTTFATIETSALKFGLGEQGASGYFDYVKGIPVGPGLALKNSLSNALYHGSIFVGENGKVIDNFYGDSTGSRFDWSALPDVYARRVESEFAPTVINSRFDDRRLPIDERIDAEVSATLLSWPTIPNGFALDLNIINRSDAIWSPGYCGMFMDWDLGPASRNFGGFDESSGILYVRSELPSLPLVGIAGLDETLATAYEISNRDEFQSGGNTDARSWQIITAGIGGFSATARDISHAAALIVPELTIGDSSERRFAIVTGHSIAEMQTVLNDIRSELGITIKSPPTSQEQVAVRNPLVSPNPIVKGQSIVIQNVSIGEVRITFYNILGQEIASINKLADATRRVELPVLPELAPGLLFYRLEHSGGVSAGKLLYLP